MEQSHDILCRIASNMIRVKIIIAIRAKCIKIMQKIIASFVQMHCNCTHINGKKDF